MSTSTLIDSYNIPGWVTDFTFLFENHELQKQIYKSSETNKVNKSCFVCFLFYFQFMISLVKKYSENDDQFYLISVESIGDALQVNYKEIKELYIYCRNRHTGFTSGENCTNCIFLYLEMHVNFFKAVFGASWEPPFGFSKTLVFANHYLERLWSFCKRGCTPW